MKNAILLHGICDREEYEGDAYPSPSNNHWLPWLQKQLLKRGYDCQTPEMPTPYKPVYSEWKAVIDRFPLDEETVLVGHSGGAGFLLRWLSKHQQSVDKLILVAPWLDPDRYMGNFLNGALAPDLMSRVGELHVFYSSDEPVSGVEETVDLIMDTYPKARRHDFTAHGHFTLNGMGTVTFPELLNSITGR